MAADEVAEEVKETARRFREANDKSYEDRRAEMPQEEDETEVEPPPHLEVVVRPGAGGA